MKTDELPTCDSFNAYDWSAVLPSTDDQFTAYTNTVSALDRQTVEHITAERIVRFDGFYADNPEGYASTDMCCLVELTDGTWATCLAWCDTTGWDCQSGVQWFWSPTRDMAISHGLDGSARQRLGLSLPEVQA